MYLFSLFAIDVRIAGGFCLILACVFGAIAWITARKGPAWLIWLSSCRGLAWIERLGIERICAWISYCSLLPCSALLVVGLVLLAEGMNL